MPNPCQHCQPSARIHPPALLCCSCSTQLPSAQLWLNKKSQDARPLSLSLSLSRADVTLGPKSPPPFLRRFSAPAHRGSIPSFFRRKPLARPHHLHQLEKPPSVRLRYIVPLPVSSGPWCRPSLAICINVPSALCVPPHYQSFSYRTWVEFAIRSGLARRIHALIPRERIGVIVPCLW